MSCGCMFCDFKTPGPDELKQHTENRPPPCQAQYDAWTVRSEHPLGADFEAEVKEWVESGRAPFLGGAA